ncbi:MAG TPA: hypothetical protein VHL80_14930, partial [Polyangia bacterium]|nr:hypothetical protein [Polyangia bacterium]
SPGAEGAGPPARQGDTLAASAASGDIRRPNGLDLLRGTPCNCELLYGKTPQVIGGPPLTLEVARTRRHS